ncbi:MAG: lipid-A-disaccharide synthase [Methylococcales bacterium]|nr:lipid-A-disaccharide synthase [Methylococcales bacterium]
MSSPRTILFSAGESSGDQHAANMFLALKKRDSTLKGIGMGGVKMRQVGIQTHYDSTNIGVIGVVEVLKQYTEIRRALKKIQQLILNQQPDLIVCVDYKEFNLKLAQFAKHHGFKVLFYVSPQVWAWRPKRVITYGKAIDMMAVIFPFETAYYEAENVPVRYVGHPSVDKVQPLRTQADDLKLFKLNPNAPIVGILPGSRTDEIKRILPVMVAAAKKIRHNHPTVQFILPQADSISDALLAPYVENTDIQVIKNQPYDVIQCCDAIITTSGTATLEIALLTIPMVIVYKLSPLTYFLGRLLVNIKMIGLPNIIADKKIVRELIQHQATCENIAAEINKILTDHSYTQSIRTELTQIKEKLGNGGGSENMATLALEMLAETH